MHIRIVCKLYFCLLVFLIYNSYLMFHFEFNVISYVALVYKCFVLFVYHVFVCFMWTPGRVASACAIANSDPNKLNCYMIYHKKLNKGPNHKPLYWSTVYFLCLTSCVQVDGCVGSPWGSVTSQSTAPVPLRTAPPTCSCRTASPVRKAPPTATAVSAPASTHSARCCGDLVSYTIGQMFWTR